MTKATHLFGLVYSFGGLFPYHHGGETCWGGHGVEEYLRTLHPDSQAAGRKGKRHTQRYREKQGEGHACRETKKKETEIEAEKEERERKRKILDLVWDF